MIGNSINSQIDNRFEQELNDRGLSLQDDETISIKSYGSHKNRDFKDESHKGSAETIDGEEKRDVSKEDLGIEEGTSTYKGFSKFNILIIHYQMTKEKKVH